MEPNKPNIPTEVISAPIKVKEFTIYRIWRSFPAQIRGMDRERLKKVGIVDEDDIELLQITTQKEFAEKYGLNVGTLSEWNKYILEHYDPIAETTKWGAKMIGNVVGALYNSALSKDPKAHADRKLFLQVMGWVEKTEQTNKHEVKGLFDYLKILNNRNNGSDNRGANQIGPGSTGGGQE